MTETLKIKATQKSPEISFNAVTGFLEFKGRSITENAFSFYQPLIDWASNFLNIYSEEITISLSFDYINSTSIVWLMKFLKKFDKFHIQNNKLKIIWYYKDEDIFETGQDIKSLMNLPINLIKG